MTPFVDHTRIVSHNNPATKHKPNSNPEIIIPCALNLSLALLVRLMVWEGSRRH